MDTQRVLALDIGTSCIKAWLADVNEAVIAVKNHGSILTEEAGRSCGFDVQRLGIKIKQAAECTKAGEDDKIDAVIIGVSGIPLGSQSAVGCVMLKDGRVAEEDLRHAQEAALLTALPDTARRLHAAPGCYRIDGRAVAQEMAVGLEGAQLECECLAVGASEEHLQPIEAAVQAAGIRFNALVSNIFVLQRAFFTEKSSCALLDIGAGSMDFIICRAGRVLRVGSLPIGSDIITEDIRQAVNFDFSHAEQLKRCFNKLDASLYGKGVVLDCSDEDVPERNVSFDFLYDIIQNRVNELVAVFFSSVAEEFAENGIGCLYITGGGIRLDAFQEALTAKFSLPVASLDLQKIPEPYRSPENAAGYGMLRYMQLRFAHLYANRQEAEKTESFSFMHRIRNFMRL